MVRVVNIHEATTHLSRLLKEVEHGEEVVIARRGKPIARLVPDDSSDSPPRRIGWAPDIVIGDDFDEPIEDMFECLSDEAMEGSEP